MPHVGDLRIYNPHVWGMVKNYLYEDSGRIILAVIHARAFPHSQTLHPLETGNGKTVKLIGTLRPTALHLAPEAETP